MFDEAVIGSRSAHRPLHIYANGASYWVTAATLHHTPYLREEVRKEHFTRELYEAADRWQIEVVAWTLMEHHYHAIFRPG